MTAAGARIKLEAQSAMPSRDSLDGQLHGADGLFVADASLIPQTVRGNIHLTVLMLAELLSSKMMIRRVEKEEPPSVSSSKL